MRALSIVLLLVSLVTGCAPSLRPEPGTPTASREECAEIDSSQTMWGNITATILIIAGTIGVTGMLLSKTDEARIATGTIGAVGAYSGGLSYSQQQGSVREYRNKKCAATR